MPNPTHQPADVSIIDATGQLGAAQVHGLVEQASRVCAFLELSGELRVRVVADAEMAAWHERHLQIPETTDVLTFDLRDPPSSSAEDGVLDADVVVCLDEARRRSTELGHGVDRELLLYIVHAVLHCTGFDDTDPAAAAAMHREEDRVLGAIGVGVTYARGSWA